MKTFLFTIALILALAFSCKSSPKPGVTESPKKVLSASESTSDDIVITTKNLTGGKLLAKAGEAVTWTSTASSANPANQDGKKWNILVENKPETFTVSSTFPNLTLSGTVPSSFQGGATVALLVRNMEQCGKTAGSNCAATLRNTAYDKVFSFPLDIASTATSPQPGLQNIPLGTDNNGGLSIGNTPIACTQGQGTGKILLGGLMTFFNPLAGIPMLISGFAQNKINQGSGC